MTAAGEDSGEDRALAARLAGQRVLICYGLLGELVASLRLDYMASQLAWLRRIGVATEVVALPTGAPVAANAGRIAAAVVADPRPAILVGHSKGGLEALAALLRPGVAARCRGFVALQSPFFGSPVADAVCGRRSLHRAAHHLLRLAGLGGGAGLHDLTTPARAAWMREHAAAIAALVGQVPVVAFGTVLDPRWRLRDQAYRPFARWMEAQGSGPNDGLVPLASARLPGACFVQSAGGHRALVTRGPGQDPVGVLRRALLAVAATPPPPPPAPAPHPPRR
ncbi:hypothetical protein ACFQY5_27270 [Paeniroseomonas aquatica]|uniref:Alpha/beta hydrolase n=1 Tax=Paeniroseomonas aquatica TaxID=373043 RepID=A0ABT8A8H4_9PROT|nr:hypothetical protein [Paeniroseomonas aquatica]MDN3566108.1 hypothetical protein [Paeniroseomonas aquatica]